MLRYLQLLVLLSCAVYFADADSSCTPQSDHTLLFAYSNDLDPEVVQDSISKLIHRYVSGNYSKFGTIRFDTKNAERFHFFDDLKSLDQSVNSNLQYRTKRDHILSGTVPNASLGFSNNQFGSDILNVLQRFLENKDEVPLCGSQIFILLKRHPLETDTSNLLADLQNHHIFVRTVMSNTPILGENYQVMYNLSELTNGIAGFADDQNMFEVIFEFSAVFYFPFQIYSINPICQSGIERMDLPILQIPQSGNESDVFSWIEISVQDHGPLDKFGSFNLTLTNTIDPTDQINLHGVTAGYQSTLQFDSFYPSKNASYSVNLLTEYSESVPENLQIRIWTSIETPIQHWLPFTNRT